MVCLLRLAMGLFYPCAAKLAFQAPLFFGAFISQSRYTDDIPGIIYDKGDFIMKKRPLGRSGLMLTEISLGCEHLEHASQEVIDATLGWRPGPWR